jgi:DNA modification methylase
VALLGLLCVQKKETPSFDRCLLFHGDSLQELEKLPDNSIDSCVTDPPYGLGKEPDAMAMLGDWLKRGHHEVKGTGFMDQSWDAFVPQPRLWREVWRVLKPGGHVLAFAGTRTYDLMTLGLRIAGFEVRDCIRYLGQTVSPCWVTGQGFPKGINVGKAVLKVGAKQDASELSNEAAHNGTGATTSAATEAAKQWQDWNVALKPSWEPIVIARKPLDGNVAENVLEWGTGALNVGACRIELPQGDPLHNGVQHNTHKMDTQGQGWGFISVDREPGLGRYPANLIHDGTRESAAEFPGKENESAARFFKSADFDSEDIDIIRIIYCPKASKRDRDDGLERASENNYTRSGLASPAVLRRAESEVNPQNSGLDGRKLRRNMHPTVKPAELCRYLVRLVTPPGGVVLDPFMGSGSTGKAAMLEGFRFIGVEREAEYVEIARARIEDARTRSNGGS